MQKKKKKKKKNSCGRKIIMLYGHISCAGEWGGNIILYTHLFRGK